MVQNPYAKYKEQSLSTLTQGELLVKLFEEMIKQCRLAVIAIGEKDLGAANNSLTKTQSIVTTLTTSLDMRFEVSSNLKELYSFFSRQLLQANLKKDPKLIEELLPLFKDLRDSFDQAEKISRSQRHNAPAPQPVVEGQAV